MGGRLTGFRAGARTALSGCSSRPTRFCPLAAGSLSFITQGCQLARQPRITSLRDHEVDILQPPALRPCSPSPQGAWCLGCLTPQKAQVNTCLP